MRAETLPALLAEGAAEAPALIHGERTITFAALEEESRRVAAGLRALGVGPGDRVALWLPNVPAWLALFLACARLGAVTVAVNTRFRSAEVEDIVGRSGARVLALWPGFKGIDFLALLAEADPAALSRVGAVILYDEGEDASAANVLPGARAVRYADLAARPPLADDAAAPGRGCAVFTTSGTTSRPKFVLHTQRSLTRHARDVARAFGYGAADAVLLQALPLCGVFGLSQALAGLAAGRPLVLMPAFAGAAAAALVARHRVTHMAGSDEMYRRMLAAPGAARALASLRHAGFAAFTGDPAALVAEGERIGVPFLGLYGMSEVQALFAARSADAPAQERARAGGRPVSAEARARVRDPESGRLLAVGESGELELRGPSLMAEYLGDPAATAAAFTEDGYVRTGDLARMEEDGGFEFLARMGDALRLGGFLVNPAEISDYVERHPAVAACRVVALDGPAGPRVVAFVTAAPGARPEEAEIRAHCDRGLAKFKIPERVFVLDAFPVTESANGVKVQLGKLREMAARLTAAGEEGAPDGGTG